MAFVQRQVFQTVCYITPIVNSTDRVDVCMLTHLLLLSSIYLLLHSERQHVKALGDNAQFAHIK